MEETTILPILAVAAFGLLVVVSGGVIYLTATSWRDRRRQENELRANRRSARPNKK
ncbi:MAG: hypothetical protein KME01_00375 [Chroococcus sp. CMT-3BRIN-NPC107]|nr:hypothetical protein [Chroococcus sp. CMT-3BRIN-NPC107]